MQYWPFLLALLCLLLLVLAWRRFLRWCEAANRVDWGNPWLNRLDGLNRHFCVGYHRLQYQPLALPEQGPAVVVANHVSGLDPLLMMAAANRPLRFMVAREQYYRWGLAWLFRALGCIPVDRRKRPERALRAAMDALAAGEVVALFPQGGIQKRGAPAKRLKGGAVRLAQKQDCAIYPVLVHGVFAHGLTVPAVLFRSNAVLRSLPPLVCQNATHHDCMQALAQILKSPKDGVK